MKLPRPSRLEVLRMHELLAQQVPLPNEWRMMMERLRPAKLGMQSAKPAGEIDQDTEERSDG